MRLHRTLFYFLLVVFVTGIFVASSVEFSTVASRIATGLISGALVGLLSSLVNYYYAWQSFIGGIYDNVFELYTDLQHEVIDAKSVVEQIENSDQQTAVSWLTSLARRIDKYEDEKNPKDTKYTKYRVKFDYSKFAPLFPFSKTGEALESLRTQVSNLGMILSYKEIARLSACLEKGHFPNKEMEEETIGDRDEFYNFIVQNMYKWRDYTACMMRELCINIVKMQSTIRPFILGKDYKELPNILCGMKDKCLKGLPVRNPLDEASDREENEKTSAIAVISDLEVLSQMLIKSRN